MSRIPLIAPDDLTPEQLGLYRRILASRSGANSPGFAVTGAVGELLGPFNAMLLAPKVGDSVQSLGDSLRNGALTGREREIVILMVAAYWRSSFEWRSHEQPARAAGLSEADLELMWSGEVPHVEDAREQGIARVADQLLAGRGLTDEQFASARVLLSAADVFEVCTLVGYYGLIALQLATFGVD